MTHTAHRWAWSLPALALGGLVWAAHRARASSETTRAALAFVERLDESQRAKLEFAFGDAYRRDWHFVPRERRGLALADLDLEQRGWLKRWLDAALSTRGLAKVDGVLELEALLRELESTPERPAIGRDPDRYVIALFGEPSDSTPWAWRFEGHHLSLSFTVIDGHVASTPFFVGANPARVPSGPLTGKRLLGEEEDAARAFVKSLDDVQRSVALPAGEAPADVLLQPGRKASFLEPAGIGASALDAAQREALVSLVELYASNLEPDLAAHALAALRDDGAESLRFLWLGGVEDGEPHYWRVQSQRFAIELDNTQNGANHAHTLWRDFANDFGEDDLTRHYAEEHSK
ncbi:MAG: DUF3500 domain-containing protein [Planctomycetes bacterium]|nr:DUF3500 domain-containing protein [Planctomycetota bacterium]